MSGLESAASLADLQRRFHLNAPQAMLLQGYITARDRAVAAQALREAAEEADRQAGVLATHFNIHPRDGSPAVETRWLRARAAALDPEEPDHD